MTDPFDPPAAESPEAHENKARAELAIWKARMVRAPGPWDRATREMQGRVNNLIPEKVHGAVSKVIETLTRAILTGSDFTTGAPLMDATLQAREALVRRRIEAYRLTAAAEGGVAGAGGFLLAAADFPALLTVKIKLLFEIAALYGHATETFAERLYLLEIFQLAFSSAQRRAEVFAVLAAWDPAAQPTSFEAFDWRRFQQEYRDHIDLAKMAQLIPVIGAPVGAVVNYRLLDRLGETAIGAYRMRWFGEDAHTRL